MVTASGFQNIQDKESGASCSDSSPKVSRGSDPIFSERNAALHEKIGSLNFERPQQCYRSSILSASSSCGSVCKLDLFKCTYPTSSLSLTGLTGHRGLDYYDQIPPRLPPAAEISPVAKLPSNSSPRSESLKTNFYFCYLPRCLRPHLHMRFIIGVAIEFMLQFNVPLNKRGFV